MATDPPPTPRARSYMPRFEARVLYGTLLVVLPAVLALLGVLVFNQPDDWRLLLVFLAVVVSSIALARWQYRRVVYPLYTLSGLIGALREGDYSMRGVPANVMGSLVDDLNDLAERLQTERLQFEESSYLLTKTLAALDSAVFVFNPQHRLRLVNPAGQQLLGSEKHRLFGRGAEELGLAGMLEGPATQVLAHAFPGRAGRFEIRHAPLRRGGRGGQLLVVNDLGRVLREEERQAWQRLLRVLGHEVNNSLAPIRSMAETLAMLALREPMPSDWREDFRHGLDLIGNRAGALSRFLSGYSQLARLPAPCKRAVDVPTLVQKVVRLEQRVHTHIEPGAPLSVQADSDQLEQALINLLRNAAEASIDGDVRVGWRSEGSRAWIEVSDDGSGPPSSDNLFVPFFTTKPGGSGIGLALVRQIVEAHDGGVSLGTRDDGERGTCAALWLPWAACRPEQDGR